MARPAYDFGGGSGAGAMGGWGRESFGDKSYLRPGDFSVFASDRAIGICELTGVPSRISNQDTALAFEITDAETIANPKAKYEALIPAIVERHKTKNAGTTFVSAAIVPPSEEEAKAGKFPVVTVANLGDSRAYLLAKMKNADGRISYVSIAISEDMDFDVKRVIAHIKAKGADAVPHAEDGLVRLTVGTGLNLGASIGDCTAKTAGGEHVLYTKPDVLVFDPNAGGFWPREILPPENILDLQVVLTCDGVSNLAGNTKKMGVDYMMRLRDDGTPEFIAGPKPGETPLHMSQLMEEADGRSPNLAEHIVTQVFERGGSTDNISAVSTLVMHDGKVFIGTPVCAQLEDGHVAGVNALAGGGKIHDESDGAIVSASVAADVFVGMKGRAIPGLEFSQSYVHSLIAQRGALLPALVPKTAVAATHAEAAAGESRGGGRGYGGGDDDWDAGGGYD